MNILISMCLLGISCRYDSGSNGPIAELPSLRQRFGLVPVCPEQLGGLCTPRLPSERRGERVVMCDGTDVTEQYYRGARQALALARLYDCRAAVLKRRSPSCGSGEVYDGTFTHTPVPGWGVTAELLRKNGLLVCDETQLDRLTTFVAQQESGCDR